MGLTAAIALTALPRVALASQGETMDWGAMLMQLVGGLALFLFGMEMMADALKKVAGDRMRSILARLTSNRLMGLLTGAFVTAVIQSSSVTTVMLVGFVSAGLMSLAQAIGVILGADIGTTITAQIVAFKVTQYALLLVAAGFVPMFVSKNKTVVRYGELVMGLGLIFFGMSVMSSGMKPLRSYDPFLELMRQVENPLVGIGIAAIFTGLIQSSSAAMGVVIALASQGLINLEAGVALALGANIGTCATAGLASIGKPREAVRVAVAHVMFKVVGVAIIFAFIPDLAEAARAMSPTHPELEGADRLAADVPRQVANAHTLFNVGIAFAFLPFSSLFARLCEMVVPDRQTTAEEDRAAVLTSKYLDDDLLDTPALALGRVELEVSRMATRVNTMFEAILPAVLAGDREELEAVAEMDDAVDALHGHIVEYMRHIGLDGLSKAQGKQFVRLIEAANNFEAIGDIVETDLVQTGYGRIEDGFVVSPETTAVLTKYHRAVLEALRLLQRAIEDRDPEAAVAAAGVKSAINQLATEAAEHCATRLVSDDPDRQAAYTREMDIVERFKRIYYFAKRIARAIEPNLRYADDVEVSVVLDLGEGQPRA